MAYTNTWDGTFEAAPPDTGESASIGASRIRDLKNAVRERMEKDHYFDEAGTDADHGEHVKVTFRGALTKPTAVADKCFMYAKDISAGNLAPFIETEAGTEICMVVPEGIIVPWCPGYFADGANGTYTNVLGTANTVLAANAYLNPLGWYVCDGAAVNSTLSTIFNGASRYLPNLTDDRFVMGDTVAGGIGGSSSLVDHTHTFSLTAAGQTYVGDSSSVSDPGDHTHTQLGNAAGAGGYQSQYQGNVDASKATGPSGAHIHTVSISHTHTASAVSGTVGTGSAASATENRPLYLGLFYIMKIM